MSLEGQEIQELSNIFVRHKQLIVDMGIYENIGRNCAANGKGLLYMSSCIKDMLRISPGGVFEQRVIREALSMAALAEPSLNPTDLKNQLWSVIRAEKLVTVFYHVRRVSRPGNYWKGMIAKMTGVEGQDLHKVLQPVRSVGERKFPAIPTSWCQSPKGEPVSFSPVGGAEIKAEEQTEKLVTPKKEPSEELAPPGEDSIVPAPEPEDIDLNAVLKIKPAGIW